VRPGRGMNGPGHTKRRSPLLGLLRWIAGHVRGFHAAIGAYLAIALAAVAVAGGVFAAVARAVARGHADRWDLAALGWMGRLDSAVLDGWALEVTALGGKVVVWMVVLLSSIFLWNSRHHYSAALLWVAALGGGLLNAALKTAFDRARPDVFPWRTPHAGLASFPSGHAMSAMVVYGTLAFLVARLAPTRFLRWLTWAVAATVILLIGLSRVYLGVHYPSDVVAGFLVGGIWAIACGTGIEAVRYFRGRRPEVAAEEEHLGPGPTEGEDRCAGAA
jgi:undecaprenyl-diphosphatase